ncbi:TPA: DUF551 domain-containing protein [Salmonella enterica subsp. enterica serovar Yarrabah]
MTTITREQQKQILIDTANHVISRDNTSPYSENLRELARIALVSLEAEPVAWECGENIILFNPDTVEAYAKRAEISPKPLFAAPPVPVAVYSVFEDFWSTCKHPYTQDDELKDFSWGIWNACRSAMLQANQRDLSQPVDPQVADYEKTMLQAGNSPVIPDGWINCSERMPAQDDWVLIYSKYGEYLAGQVQGKYVELNDGTLSWLGAALHWMPLPEPPRQ